MARIAVIADIHGNMPALEAVVEDLRRRPVGEVLVAGDLVGRGPEGGRVVRTIAELGWRTIRGNHEDYLLTFRRGDVPEAWLTTNEWSAARWMAAELSPFDAEFIDALPFSVRARSAPGLLLVHGSPRSCNEGLGPWTSDVKLDELLREVDEPLLVCAHTHRPMHRRLETGEVVNVGSVGLPFNRDRRAQYAVFEADGDGWSTEFRQVDYDLDETLRIYETSGFLAAGGVTAHLLLLELRHASPFLVPFLKWAALTGTPAETSHIDEFLGFYDPAEPLHDFFLRLESLRGSSTPQD